MPEWTPPSEFDGYRLVRPLGRGGMGQVFLGQDVLLERPVAVKFIAALNPDESHRQRFIQEGRAIARLSHPNVVAIHRVGEVQGHPYFVAEYVRGQPLDAVTKPLPWERVLRIGRGLARGLAAAHRQGVLHRDLKPSNIVVTESGETKLLDFGLAKLITELEPVEENGDDTRTRDLPRSRADPSLTHPDLILGTPRYMAPEVLAGEPSSRRSDLFALGVVLFELCMGKAPDRSGDRALPPVRGMPGVNVRLAEIIDRCASVDPEQRFASADELLDALDHVVPERRELVLPEGNPYRGLRPFEAEHRALFFGRDIEIRAVLERLRSDARVVVAGDSGVGKSSLCRAGVLPLVNDGALGETNWRVVRLVPGRRPLVALAAALSPALEVNEEALGAWLSSEPAALARALQRARQKTPGFGLLVFVDQAEELFTLAPAEESGVVAEALGALGTTPHARMLLAVRGDFVTRLASLPGIGEELAASLYLLRPMTAEKLREVIVGPARARGFRYESDEMVERLVHSGLGSPGALPLLQFTLAELWEARNEELRVLPAAALDQVGGVEGALSRHADALLAALRPEQREEVRRILVRLVTAEGTRVRRTASELEARSGPAAVALDALVGARLVVAREIEGESTFELVHEALISGWGTLHEWLDDAADQRRLIQRLEAAATEWERLGQTREAVWRGRQLMEASSLDRGSLGKREAAFLEHSQQERRRLKAWRAMGFAAAPLVLLVAVLLAQLRTRSQLDSRVSTHLEVARSAMDEGRTLTAEALSGAREAFGLYDERAPSEPGASRWDRAESRWAAALGARSAAEGALARGVRALETAVLIDPSRQDVRQLLAEGTYRLIELGVGMDGSDPAPSLVQRLQTYDLSRRWIPFVEAPAKVVIAVHPEGAQLRLERYRPIAGKLVPELVREGVAGSFGQVELPAGSYLLVATAPGRHEVRDPFRVQSGATEELRFTLPDTRAVGPDFVYVPPGKYLTGIRGNEELRKALGAPPMHEVRTEGYLIQRTEVTFGEYLGRIASMGPEGRQLRPHVTGAGGSVEVEQRPAGPWRARFEFSSARYSVSEGEPVVYATRKRLQSQDWRKFPVLGVSPSQARRYAGLVGDGRPTRLCRESEWERAARGADGRSFTLGERVEPTEANFDLSHGRAKGSMGPDQVDAHPQSASPFGVLDLQGNAFEIVTSVHDDATLLEKGGSWYHDLGLDGHLGARLAIDEETRSARLGFRLCADVAGETK